MTLIETLGDNGNTEAINWQGKAGTLFASGDFSGGNVKLQLSIDGTTWFNAKDESGTDLALTVNGAFSFSVGNCKVRAALAGAAAPLVLVSIQERSF